MIGFRSRKILWTRGTSLRGELFGEVARPVRVVAEGNGRVKGQSLQRDDAKQGREGFARLWHLADARLVASNEIVEELQSLSVGTVSDDDCKQVDLLGHELAHGRKRDSLVLRARVNDDENGRGARVDDDIVEEVVHDVAESEALAVQVA